VSVLAFGASAFSIFFARRADERANRAENRAEGADRRDRTRFLIETRATQSALHAEYLDYDDASGGFRTYTIRVTNTGGGLASDARAYLVNRHGESIIDRELKRVLPGGTNHFEEVELSVNEQALNESPLGLRLKWRDDSTGEDMERISGARFPPS